MSWLSKLFGKGSDEKAFGTDPKIMTEVVQDPYKTAVSSPLSSFLAGQIGKGIGEGPEIDPNYTNRYNEYLSVNPGEYFDKNIANPATQRYKEDFLPVIREGYAGNLRGSGRFGAEEAGINRFSQDLATTKAAFVPEFNKSQIEVGQSEFQRRYGTWYASLPETNPALATSIQFLNSDSGYNILSALDPGKKGWFFDLLNTGVSAAASYFAGGK